MVQSSQDEFVDNWEEEDEENEQVVEVPIIKEPDDLQAKWHEETDWRKRAIIAARMISKSLE